MNSPKNSNKITVISETDLGIYVWQMPDGRFVTDKDLNVMNIVSRRNDLQAMATLTRVARKHDIHEGRPYFIEGARRTDDEELKEQVERMKAGLVPDPYDIGVYKESLRNNE